MAHLNLLGICIEEIINNNESFEYLLEGGKKKIQITSPSL